MEYLDLNLNEIASDAIKNKIKTLENDLKQLRERNIALYVENKELVSGNEKYSNFFCIYETINKKFNEIKEITETEDNFFISIKKGRFNYIVDLMKFMFGIECSKSYCEDANLNRLLAINFYNNKKELISLLNILNEKNIFKIDKIQKFKMPIDFSKDEIIDYVKKPHYCTNGINYGSSKFYLGGDDNITHDLLQKNKYILDDEVFNELINTIKNKRSSNYSYLYTVYKYNELPLNKIQLIGECLIDEGYYYKEIRSFISDNLSKFNKKTLDYLKTKITTSNKYNLFHWEKFPVEYQYDFMMNLEINDILSYLTDYSCKWSDKQKDEFFKIYYKNKK